MRIERLWGISPPTPVWPGSPQTALIFVGLPLLTALVLLATPLHDVAPPTPREEVATAAPREEVAAPVNLTAPGLRVVERGTIAAAMPRAVTKRQPVDDERVPAVIYEVRRTRQHVRDSASTAVRGSAPAVMAARTTGAWLAPAAVTQPTTLVGAPAQARAMATSVAPQSP